MERILAEAQIVRFTAPRKTRDKYGNELPEESRVPTELSSKVERGEVSHEKQKALQNVLNYVLPPREWEVNGEFWGQQVSQESVNRDDVIQLNLLLNRKLKDTKALDYGIDSVRRYIYNQLMDELARQEIINCPDRGILLLRIRDELRMTIETSEALFEESKIFGSRRASAGGANQAELLKRLNRHQQERDSLLTKVKAYRKKYVEAEKMNAEKLIRYDKVCIEELQPLHEIAVAFRQLAKDISLGMN